MIYIKWKFYSNFLRDKKNLFEKLNAGNLFLNKIISACHSLIFIYLLTKVYF